MTAKYDSQAPARVTRLPCESRVIFKMIHYEILLQSGARGGGARGIDRNGALGLASASASH